MRVACEQLNRDFGISLEGDVAAVNYSLRLGELEVAVDWANATGNGAKLTRAQIKRHERVCRERTDTR